jgi:hypothetical protein
MKSHDSLALYTRMECLQFTHFTVHGIKCYSSWISTGSWLGYKLDNRNYCILVGGKRLFSSPKVSRPAAGPTQPRMQWVADIFLWVKQLGREANHFPPCSVEVRNVWHWMATQCMPLWLAPGLFYLQVFKKLHVTL